MLDEVVGHLSAELAVHPGNTNAQRLLVAARRALAQASASGEPEAAPRP